MSDQDKVLTFMRGAITHGQQKEVMKYAEKYKMFPSRLISIAIDNELQRDEPFKFDCTIPDKVEEVEHAFADEIGKIARFMRKIGSALSVDVWVMCRAEMGVPDKETFLKAFRVALDSGFIIPNAKVSRSKDNPRAYTVYGFNKRR